MAKFVGKRYKLHSSENLDEYMTAVEASDAVRTLAKAAKPSVELVKNGDSYSLRTIGENSTRDITFKVGQEFEQTLIDGRKVPTTFTLEGDNKIIETHRAHKPSTVIREFSEDQIKITMTADGITAVRIYKRE